MHPEPEICVLSMRVWRRAHIGVHDRNIIRTHNGFNARRILEGALERLLAYNSDKDPRPTDHDGRVAH
jgi:hypothetical protein